MLKNMCIQQQERYKEDTWWCYDFAVAQEEHFKLVQDHLTAQNTTFEIFASYATVQFNQIREDMEFNYGSTSTGINKMIHHENENHVHYIQF